MNTCGIVLKASDATLCVIDDKFDHIEVQRKITLGDDETKGAIVEFMEAFTVFVKENDIAAVGLKKRSKTGRYAGGGLTFKMETLIQMAGDVPLHFITPQALSAFEKKSTVEYPDSLTKDQQPAYLTALYVSQKLNGDC